MKKFIALAAAAVALFTFTPTEAQAGGYRSKVIGTCQHCRGHIHSYYKPVRYSDGCVRYVWVPSYHTNCASRYSRNTHSQSSYGYRGGTTNYRSYSRPTYRSYSRPGGSISFSFGSGRFCR